MRAKGARAEAVKPGSAPSIRARTRGDVVELETRRAEGLELSANLRPHLSAHMGKKKHRGAGERHIRPKPAARIDQIRDK
jgi:hypothetical protein